MPIEIRELIIKVTVQAGPDPSPSPTPRVGLPAGDELRQWQQELTQTCVRQVLSELQRQRER